MRKSRKLLTEYAKIVAAHGPDSPAAASFRRGQDGDEDFAQLARLTDFFFKQMNANTIPESSAAAATQVK
jgi:hypothetical protein